MCALTEVLTVSEVAHIWEVHESTVWYHLNRGDFRWRDTRGGFALIDRGSVAEYWGDMPFELAVYEKTRKRG
jgi:hypothetical protein